MKNLTLPRALAARLFATALLMAGTGSALADVHYVDVNGTNATLPYLSWATAATNIQDAVDAAVAGDEIVVTNGLYATGGRAVYGTMTNRVAVDKPLTLRSVNGPQFTIIEGRQVPGDITGNGAIRCVYLTNGASLSGFTLTKGATHTVIDYPINRESAGGGVWCESPNTAAVSNCVVSGNSAYFLGGGAYGGTLNNCALTGNSVVAGGRPVGGGAAGCTLNNCTLTGNSVAGDGGGAYKCALNNCTLSGNYAYYGAGGTLSSTLDNCTLTRNSGGAYLSTLNNCSLTDNYRYGAASSTLNSCALTGNSGWGADSSILSNCTVTGNSGGGATRSSLKNCIVYFNTGQQGSNYDSSCTLNYSCTIPQPTNGVGNITNEPAFVDQASGNLRLQSNSPCLNAGSNAFAPAGPDLDGNPRIVRGTVDIGAYEFQGLGSMISYVWLQQYALPTDGSADVTDPDGDGLNNWQEWRCATDPTNSLSVLRLQAPISGGTNVLVTWQSVAGMNYYLERSPNLGESPAFTPVAMGIPGQPDTTTYTDTNVIGSGPFFYRVGVGD